MIVLVLLRTSREIKAIKDIGALMAAS